MASSISFKISPWQYRTESHGAVTEPLVYRPLAKGAAAAMAAASLGSDGMGDGREALKF